jgi:esterase/lipase superfamily enzyme
MSVLDRAKAHYAGLGRKEIKVPEWGPEGQPFVVYATPLTVGQRDKIRESGNVDTAAMFVDVLIQKAQTKDGEAAFTPADRHDLTHNVDSRIVSRIALEIMAGPSDEDLEKN